MCGLVGILDRQAGPGESETILRRMAATLIHRGPDGEGYVTGGACGLGFRRLAILDVDAPSPPFANEDRSVWSVANAEIYNGGELRRALEQRGHVLKTRVDTEVVPHLWEEDGAGLVPRLNGMFALAVWDERRETLLLARDRTGEKPLFYWRGDDDVPVFALGHADPEFDESRDARETSRLFGAEFHQLVLDESDLAEGLRRVGEGFDEPLGDASTIPSHLLAHHARRRVKVVLSGEGASFRARPSTDSERGARFRAGSAGSAHSSWR